MSELSRAAGSIGVTGADGFIGAHLCAALEAQQIPVARIVRRKDGVGPDRRTADLVSQPLEPVLRGVDTLIHLAGRAHVLHETEANPALAFQRANVDATMRLAEAAARSGVRRLVFVSSIGVHGNETHGRPFTEFDEPAPIEPYAASKLRAERSLQEFCRSDGLELVIVRPPLVYGAGAAGNFGRLLRLAARGIPLPLGAVRNRRNLIGVTNLCDFLQLCAEHPAAAGEVFVIAEPEVRSTPQLLTALAHGLGRPSRVFSVPLDLLRLAATVVGQQREFAKLCGSLEVSADKARTVLGWQPRTEFADEVAAAAAAYLRGRRT